METIAIERTVWIKATRERVWRALTDTDEIEKWFAPGTTFKSSGNEIGSRLYVENPETGEEMYVQILEVYDPPNHLVTRSKAEDNQPSFVTAYKLEEEKDGTRLTFIFSGYEGLPEDIRQKMMDENAAGFDLMLGNIKAVVEGTPLPHPTGF